jgi:hypothetical protein
VADHLDEPGLYHGRLGTSLRRHFWLLYASTSDLE